MKARVRKKLPANKTISRQMLRTGGKVWELVEVAGEFLASH